MGKSEINQFEFAWNTAQRNFQVLGILQGCGRPFFNEDRFLNGGFRSPFFPTEKTETDSEKQNADKKNSFLQNNLLTITNRRTNVRRHRSHRDLNRDDPTHRSILRHLSLMRMKHISPPFRKSKFYNDPFGLSESNHVRMIVRNKSRSSTKYVECLSV